MMGDDERTMIVVDTETTSKYPEQAQILEVAAVAYVGEQEVGCFQTLVYATPLELERAQDALRINGITAEMLAGAPSPDYARALFRQFLTTFRSPELTAFNASYDRQVLRNSKWLEGHEPWGRCVMLAAQRDMGKHGALEYNEYHGDYKWPRLSEAATYYKVVDEAAAHRALADARTAGRVMLAIRRAESTVAACEVCGLKGRPGKGDTCWPCVNAIASVVDEAKAAGKATADPNEVITEARKRSLARAANSARADPADPGVKDDGVLFEPASMSAWPAPKKGG